MFSVCYHFISSDPSGAEHLPMDILASQNLLNLGWFCQWMGMIPCTFLDSRLCSYDMTPVLAVSWWLNLDLTSTQSLVCTKLRSHSKPSWPLLHCPWGTETPEGVLTHTVFWVLGLMSNPAESIIEVNIPSRLVGTQGKEAVITFPGLP